MDWPLLASLDAQEQRDLLALGRQRTFARNEVICHEGDPADSLHLVVEGRVSVKASLDSGDTVMVNLLGPGGYFGELALLRPDSRRTATVTALEPARTHVITASAFRRLCETRPEVERTVSVLLAERVDQLTKRLLEVTYVSLNRRIYRWLLDLQASYADGTEPTVIPLTQAQLAELTGGTRPSVNQVLRPLVEQGVVGLGRGRIEILDLDRLRRKCGP